MLQISWCGSCRREERWGYFWKITLNINQNWICFWSFFRKWIPLIRIPFEIQFSKFYIYHLQGGWGAWSLFRALALIILTRESTWLWDLKATGTPWWCAIIVHLLWSGASQLPSNHACPACLHQYAWPRLGKLLATMIFRSRLMIISSTHAHNY